MAAEVRHESDSIIKDFMLVPDLPVDQKSQIVVNQGRMLSRMNDWGDGISDANHISSIGEGRKRGEIMLTYKSCDYVSYFDLKKREVKKGLKTGLRSRFLVRKMWCPSSGTRIIPFCSRWRRMREGPVPRTFMC